MMITVNHYKYTAFIAFNQVYIYNNTIIRIKIPPPNKKCAEAKIPLIFS